MRTNSRHSGFHPTLACALVASLSALAPACLAPDRGTVGSDVADSTTDTNTQDTNADTREVDDTDPCSTLSCDDQDPCTVDSCEDGVCLHVVPAQPEPVCVEHADCDDGDPCTDDYCGGLDGECKTTAFCTHERRVGCPAVDCDLDSEDLCVDGNPCTADRCDRTVGCVHEPFGEGLCEPGCIAQGALTIGDLRSQPEGSEVRVVGSLGPSMCNMDALPCTVQPTLDDGTEAATLYGDRAGICTLEVLGPTTCDPMVLGARYVVWGRTRADAWGLTPGNADAVPVIPRMPGLEVDDYCLDVSSLEGSYRGVLWIEADEVLVFDATITLQSGAQTLTISQVQVVSSAWARIDTTAFSAQAPTLLVRDGRVSLSLQLPWLNATPEVEAVTLFSTAEMLIGPIGPFFSPASGADSEDGGAAEDTLPWGQLRLVRLAR